MKTHIIIHHSATADGREFNWGAIRKYHIETNKWRDIGYHFGIEDINGHEEILLGRMPEEDGAHCKDHNMNVVGIGICLVGNFDTSCPTNGLLGKAASLVKWLMERYGIPAKNVWGHREAQAAGGVPAELRKTCPGKTFDMDRFRTML